jgi:hypothetical protein
MGLQARVAGAWRVVPTDNSRLLYLRVGGVWKPILDFWSRDQSAWHHDPSYSPQMPTPTNFRNNGTPTTTHDRVQVAWDYSGLLPPDNFWVLIMDQNGNGLRWDQAPGGANRTWTATGLATNTYYQLAVMARYAGRPDTPLTPNMHWYTGYASYVVNDVPVYGWGGEFEAMPSTYSQSSAAVGDYNTWGFQKAIDGNFSTYWNSDVVDPNVDSYQGEGFRLWVPGGNYLLNGVRLWNLGAHTVWYGVSLNGGSNWQGGSTPYFGKYGFLVHGYNVGVANVGSPGDVRSGQYQTNGQNAVVDCLLQVPAYDGYNWRIGVIEVRLLLQQWVQTGWGPRTVPEAASGNW